MCSKCGFINLSVKVDGIEPEVKRIAQLIYEGKLAVGQIDKAMVKKVADELMKGIFKGYGKKLTSKDLTDEERTFLTQLNENVYVFSGFKNYQQLKETTLLLKDDNGKLKSFADFLTDVKQVNETYNEVYLNSEYGTAIASAQAAASWQDFINNGIDTLTFQTAEDDKVRPEHQMLDGMTVDIDSPVLDTYYTPLDWGCRCEWIPGQAKDRTSVKDYLLPDIPPMFQNNVGKSGIVFPDTHPYYDVSKSVAKSVRSQVKDILEEE